MIIKSKQIRGSVPDESFIDLGKLIYRLKTERKQNHASDPLENPKDLFVKSLDEFASACAQDSGYLLDLPEKDIEPAFNLIVALLVFLSEDTIKSVIVHLKNALLADTKRLSYLKVKIFTNIYNGINLMPILGKDIFMAVLKILSDNGEVELVKHKLKDIETLVKKWQLEVEDEREVYKNIASILLGTTIFKTEGYEFMLKYLSTYENDSASELNKAESAIKETLDYGLMDPTIVFYDNIIKMNAVKHFIKLNSVYGKLLQVFNTGDFFAYMDLFKKNEALFKSVNLGTLKDENHAKIRKIALCKLFEKNLYKDLPYSEIAKAISISNEDVPLWLTTLFEEGLADFLINELDETVRVSKCLFTNFEKETWLNMKERLVSWDESMDDILRVLEEAKTASYCMQPQKV